MLKLVKVDLEVVEQNLDCVLIKYGNKVVV